MNTFIKSLIERSGKTFVQVFVTVWLATAGLGGTPMDQPNLDTWDKLFNVDNLKLALIAAGLSVVTSLASKPVGPSGSTSLVVDEVEPGPGA